MPAETKAGRVTDRAGGGRPKDGMDLRPGPTQRGPSRDRVHYTPVVAPALFLSAAANHVVQRGPSRDLVHYKPVASPPGSAVTHGDHKVYRAWY